MQQYRVFVAMLELGEFTVAELAEAADVGQATVRTTINRNAALLEEVGREETGRRGGAWIRYRLSEAGRVAIRERLQDLRTFDRLDEGAGVPSEIAAAERLLIEEITQADGREMRESVLRRARRLASAGRRKLSGDATDNPNAAAHLAAIDVLLDLVRLEHAGTGDVVRPWRELVDATEEHAPELRRIRTMSTLYADVHRRLLEGRLPRQLTRRGAALPELARDDTRLEELAVAARRLRKNVVVSISPAGSASEVDRLVEPAGDYVRHGMRVRVGTSRPATERKSRVSWRISDLPAKEPAYTYGYLVKDQPVISEYGTYVMLETGKTSEVKGEFTQLDESVKEKKGKEPVSGSIELAKFKSTVKGLIR